MSSKTTVIFLGKKCEVQVNFGHAPTKLVGEFDTPEEAVAALEGVVTSIRGAKL